MQVSKAFLQPSAEAIPRTVETMSTWEVNRTVVGL